MIQATLVLALACAFIARKWVVPRGYDNASTLSVWSQIAMMHWSLGQVQCFVVIEVGVAEYWRLMV